MSEILKMNDADLVKFVSEKREALQKMRFGANGSGMRNSFTIRNTRKEIARALTELTKRSKVGA